MTPLIWASTHKRIQRPVCYQNLKLIGLVTTAGHFNDLRSFKQHDYEWADLTGRVSGFYPSPRTKHSVTSTGTSIYVYGGSSDEGKKRFFA